MICDGGIVVGGRQEGQRIVEQERHETERAGEKCLNRDPGGSMRDTRLIGLLTERLSSIAYSTTTFSNSSEQ